MVDVEANPLLKDFYFPPFDVIEAKHVRPGIRALLKKLECDLEELESTVEPTWPKLVEPLERIVDRLAVVWGVVSHLKSVKDNADLRSAIEEVQPEKVAFELKLGQSKPLYNAFKAIRESSDWEVLSDARKRIVEAQIKEAVLNGVALEDDKREEFNNIEQELAKLSQKFGENVLDSTKKFEKLITDKKEIDGLPDTALGLAAQTAVSKGHENATAADGPWVITLDAPSFMAVMQHAINRTLREEVYRAYISRASSGDLDNTKIIEQILKLRLEKAKLLGYNNYAEVSMATKMATVEKAEELLDKLRIASWNPAVQDMEDLKLFAKNQGAPEADDLTHWDTSFWSERLRETKYEINEEELRPYFSLPKIMDGLFSLANKLFGVRIEAADGFAPVWISDVRFYRVNDSSGIPIAYFYFDPYSRPSEKRGGAWMDEVVGRSHVLSQDGSSPRLPVAHMVCNQMPPVGDKPSLMTFREVETVFHEFGHALQHMLTKQDEGLVAGIRNVEWDAVELPSQFMENWCYHRDTLMSIGKHHETGESIPDDIYEKLLAARTFRAGSLSLRQLRFATLDLELHTKYVPGGPESIYDVDRRVAKRTQILPPLPDDKFLCSFSHIFAGGYAAGYYSYKWAEVLSADAFSAFEDAGLDNDKAVKETGNRFRETVLALGGGKAPLEVSDQDMADTYQAPFRSCIQRGNASCLMCSYNSINGIPACANHDLLQKARTDWNFRGYITSDCDAVATIYEDQKYTKTPEEAVAAALRAGTDINCGTYMLRHMKSAIEQGNVLEEDIDRALLNLFSVQLRLGLFDGEPERNPFRILGPQDVCTTEHKSLALEAARQGIVLLKNEQKLMPLDKCVVSSLAVIGPLANSTNLGGGYTGIPCNPKSILEGLEEYVNNIYYAAGCQDVPCNSSIDFLEALFFAKEAEYVVVVAGLDLSQETEDHDRYSLLLPGCQMELITAIAAVSRKPLILVLIGGGPIDVSFAVGDPRIGSILWIGYPGETGGIALSEIIFGQYNPGGRLPMTWYLESFTSVPMSDMNMRADPSRNYPGRTYRFYTGDKVYGFGYGLSYTSFTYQLLTAPRKLSIRKSIASRQQRNMLYQKGNGTLDYLFVDEVPNCSSLTFQVQISVTNTGDIHGSEVVLLFSKAMKSFKGSPERQLIGFERVRLLPYGTAETSFLVDPCEHFSFADEWG